MTFLSRYVEAPENHIREGLVVSCARSTLPLAGNWSRIVSSKGKPSRPFVSVQYRGHWFYIPDNALDAKETFGLLTQLFSLQASDSGGRRPLLTIPTG